MITLLCRTEPAGRYYLGVEAMPPRGERDQQEGRMLTLVAAGVDVSRLRDSWFKGHAVTRSHVFPRY